MSPRRTRGKKRSKETNQQVEEETSEKLGEEEEELIEKVKENLMATKRIVAKQGRLAKLKFGPANVKRPFSKELFAKGILEFYKNPDQSSSLSTLSFINVASSTGNISRREINNSGSKSEHPGRRMSQRLVAKDIMQTTVNQSKVGRKSQLRKDVEVGERSCRRSERLNCKEIELKRGDLKTCNSIDGYGIGRRRSERLKSKELANLTFNLSKFESSRLCNSDAKLRFSLSIERMVDSATRLRGSRRAVALVTPGPQIHRPLAVLRRPDPGELAVSLFGSPLLVSSDLAPTSLPQINLPTADGKVVSILPRSGFAPEDMPPLATPTRTQLRTLNTYLNRLCQENSR